MEIKYILNKSHGRDKTHKYLKSRSLKLFEQFLWISIHLIRNSIRTPVELDDVYSRDEYAVDMAWRLWRKSRAGLQDVSEQNQ